MRFAMTDVVLSFDDVALARARGAERQRVNAGARVGNMNYSGRDDEAIHVQGALGELAFMRLHGIVPDALDDTKVCSAACDRFDCTLADGRTVDVKTTKAAYAHVAIQVGMNKYAKLPDLYALMLVHDVREDGSLVVQYAGAVPSGTLMTPPFMRCRKGHWCYRLESPNPLGCVLQSSLTLTQAHAAEA